MSLLLQAILEAIEEQTNEDVWIDQPFYITKNLPIATITGIYYGCRMRVFQDNDNISVAIEYGKDKGKKHNIPINHPKLIDQIVYAISSTPYTIERTKPPNHS